MTPKTDSVAVLREYADRDHEQLGEHYTRHVAAMTAEGLHAKSDIAAELAWRDAEIERLRAALSAQGAEPVAWLVQATSKDVFFGEDAAKRYAAAIGAEAQPLYTAPGGVGDAVTDTQRLDWLEENGCGDFVRYPLNSPARRWYDMSVHAAIGADYFPSLRAAIDAALASRTGKGEANV